MYSSPELTISEATLEGEQLTVALSDGRIVIYPLTGMTWITEASLADQRDFTVTEWEIYWPQIDDGLTLEHLLSPRPRVDFTVEPHPNWERFRQVIAASEEETAHEG